LWQFFLVKKSEPWKLFFASEKRHKTKKLAADDGKLLLIKKDKIV
jgi:hypothetical protein